MHFHSTFINLLVFSAAAAAVITPDEDIFGDHHILDPPLKTPSEAVSNPDFQISGSPSPLDPIETIHRGRPNDTNTIQIGDCRFSSYDEYYIKDFLQERLDGLANTDHCWIIKGVQGLKELLERNISANPLNNVTIPKCVLLNVTSSGNTFSINFSANTFDVNGVSEDDFFILTYVHLISMTVAFFLAYPIILVLALAPSLCFMVDRPLSERSKNTVERWQLIVHLGIFTPLMILGLVTGIIGMGSTDHARTEHGVIGYVTVGLASVALPVYLYKRRLNSRPEVAFYAYRRLKFLNGIDFVICQAILLISGFALPDGIDDFGVMTLCGTNTISSSLTFSLGMIISFVWNCAMATMTVQWLLGARIKGVAFRDRAPAWMLKVLRKKPQ